MQAKGMSFTPYPFLCRIWLVDLARYLPASARIDGFDIDLTQCPPKEWLPPNVSVHNLDCLAPLPDRLVGRYDIVHIQLFHLAVHSNDPAPIIKNLVKLLSMGPTLSVRRLRSCRIARC